MNAVNKSWFTQPRATLNLAAMFFVLTYFITPLASLAQTFDKGFELVSGTLPTLTDDMDGNGTNESYKVDDTGGYTSAPNLSPFAVWGGGQGGYLVNSQFNAHTGSNFFMLSGNDNCFGLLSACSFSNAKTYKITFWAAAWAPSGTTGSLSPSLDIKREPGVSNTMWVVGTTQGQSIVNSFYSGATTGSEATWAAGTSNYFALGTGWNALPISNTTTLTWTKYEYTFTNVGGLTKIWISKFGGADGYLCIDDITCDEVCTKPNAGTDQSPVCVGTTPITTATLAATAVTGGAWTQLGTTPNTATITTPSSATSTVTGLIPGVYQFIWATSSTCSDTVKITIPSCVCSLAPPLLTMTALEFGSGFGNAPQSENFTLNGGANTTPENNIAGFHITASNEGSFFAFCTEINQPLLPIQSPYTHEVNGTTNGFTASQALRLSQLMQAAGFDPITGFGSSGTIAKYVAMQMAVWNVMYDTDYSVSSGTFYSVTDNNGSKAIADAWLATAQTITSPTVEVHQIHHSTGQDCVIPKPVPPISLTVTQPTCTGANSPNNGSITIVGFTAGQRYQYSTGTTFNSASAIPASITAIPTGGIITTSLPNTTSSYTVRVYDATDDACFTDRTVSITAAVCCTKPSAGIDQSPACVGNTAITTATLAATAVSGGAWTQVSTNPAGAVVTTPSSETSTVTGLTPGVYQFIWSTSATCSDTVKITIPSCVTTCPTIVQSADTTVCAGSTITLRADLTGITTEDIKFVYFNTHQTSTSIIYGTPDGVLGTVTNAQLTAGKTKAAVSVTIPASPASTTYHVYAILSPTPADANCRPYGHRHVITDPSKCPCGLPECLGVTIKKN